MGKRKNKLKEVRPDITYIVQEAADFERSFDKQEIPTPIDVLKKLGFQKIGFSELDPQLQLAMEKNADKRWYGHPLRINGQLIGNEIILQDSEGTVIHFFRENSQPNGRADYFWSRLKRGEDGYYVNEMNHNCDMNEIIHNIAIFEIIGSQSLNGSSNYPESAIRIPFVEEVAVRDARAKIERL